MRVHPSLQRRVKVSLGVKASVRRSTLPCPLPFLANRSAVLLLRPLLGLPRVDHLGRRSRNSTGERRPRGVEEIGFAFSWSIDTVWLIPRRIRGEICRVDNLFCEVDAVLAMYTIVSIGVLLYERRMGRSRN